MGNKAAERRGAFDRSTTVEVCAEDLRQLCLWMRLAGAAPSMTAISHDEVVELDHGAVARLRQSWAPLDTHCTRVHSGGAMDLNLFDERLKGLGISQAKLAQRIDLNPATISRVYRGHVEPTLEVARRISAALGVTVDALFPGARRAQRSAA